MQDGIKSEINRKILRYLSFKARTEHEVREKISEMLKNMNISEELEKNEILNSCLDFLRDSHLLDDSDYVLSYIEEQKRKSKPKGPQYILRFLWRKGVDRKLCTYLISKHYPVDEEIRLIKKNIEKSKALDPAKLFNLLNRAGFTSSAINTFVDRNSEKA